MLWGHPWRGGGGLGSGRKRPDLDAAARSRARKKPARALRPSAPNKLPTLGRAAGKRPPNKCQCPYSWLLSGSEEAQHGSDKNAFTRARDLEIVSVYSSDGTLPGARHRSVQGCAPFLPTRTGFAIEWAESGGRVAGQRILSVPTISLFQFAPKWILSGDGPAG
jgi:hypothetical protein